MKTNQDSQHYGQYLTFNLRDENFAITITKVREVLDVATLTKIPGMPDFISGVINLRGRVVPVMDLGQKLGMGQIDKTRTTSIIIAEIGDEESVVMGALTDAVQMVVDLPEDGIEPVPRIGNAVDVDFIRGMGRLDEDKFLIILDIERVLASDGQALLQNFNLDELAFAASSLSEPEQPTEPAQPAS